MTAGKAMVRTWLTGFILLVATACGASEETPPRIGKYRLPTEEAHVVTVPLVGISVSDVPGSDGLLPVLPELPEDAVATATEAIIAPPAPQTPEVTAASVAGEPRDWLIAANWPEHLIPQALAVAWCESKHSPGAIGDGGRSLGWLQLWHGWFAYAGEDIAQWADPVVNARVGLAVYHYDINRGQAPFTQWTCKP